MDYIICHYHEIGLKGGNRKFFEQKLAKNIKKSLPQGCFENVRRISGRIIVKLKKISKEDKKRIRESLKNVFGVAYFSFAYSCDQDIESIQKKSLQILKGQEFNSFRVTTKRSKKEFPLNSQEVNEKVGSSIVKERKKDVDLENPQLTLFIEIVEDFVFLYLEEIQGPGGLPTSTAGKVGVLLSGGIDSPVAAFFAMKRGAKAFFVHFHAYPYTSKASVEKAKRLVKALNKFQSQSQIYLVPFGDIQKEILLNTEAKLRIILYRRFMVRIAQEIAKKEKALALVTGESIGQVSSQTLENMGAINDVATMPVLRPLVGFDKQEIINKAKEIGTFEISILPHEDCCARFLPDHPETKADLKEVKRAERELDVEDLVKQGTNEAMPAYIRESL